MYVWHAPDSITQQGHLGQHAGPLAAQGLLGLPGLLAVGPQQLQVSLSPGGLQLLRLQSLPRSLQILVAWILTSISNTVCNTLKLEIPFVLTVHIYIHKLMVLMQLR